MPRPHPPEVREQVFQLAREGKCAKEITRATGVYDKLVRTWCRKEGIEIKKARVRRIRPCEQRAIIALREKDPTITEAALARKFGLAQSSVHYLLKKNPGFSTRRITELLCGWKVPGL